MELQAKDISKRYFRKTGSANYFDAVRPLSLKLEPGTVTVLGGRSGSGKTTLLHMLGGLLAPTEGSVTLDGKDLYSLGDEELSGLRSSTFGVIPQGRSVIDTLTVMENLLLPGALRHRTIPAEEARGWLEKLGILHLAEASAAELSGGELRRTAIARALCGKPPFILADEPTGDLDDENTKLVLQCFRQAADKGAAVFIVTHESDVLQIADRAFRMTGGEMTLLAGTESIGNDSIQM